MATLLQNVQTTDDYSPALTLGPHPDAESVLLRVGDQPVLVTFWIQAEGQKTPVEEGQERYYNANAIVSVANVYGIKVRSAVAGNPSVVTLELVEDKFSDPDVSFQATGTSTPAAVSQPTRQIFDVAGTFAYTPPAGCVAILVECVGGGGRGGNANVGVAGQVGAGGGGGGGAYAASLLTIANLTAPLSVTVGAGGVGAQPGRNTDFFDTGLGNVVLAAGGPNGADMTQGPAPLTNGGTTGGLASGSDGDVTVDGGAGGPGICTQAGTAGEGGAGGAGAVYGTPTVGPHSIAANGIAGTQYGSGGSGGVRTLATALQTGGTGGTGVVVITEFY